MKAQNTSKTRFLGSNSSWKSLEIKLKGSDFIETIFVQSAVPKWQSDWKSYFVIRATGLRRRKFLAQRFDFEINEGDMNTFQCNRWVISMPKSQKAKSMVNRRVPRVPSEAKLPKKPKNRKQISI